MKISKSSIATSTLIIIAIFGVLFSALQYFSSPRPSLHATVHGYPHHHLIDWEQIDPLDSQFVLEKSIFGQQSDDIDRVHGVIQILLKNEGNEKARNISVIVDYAIGMMISRGNESEIIFGDRAILGDMRPNEDVTIISWTKARAIFRRYTGPRVSITYDNGVVELDQRYEIEGVLRFVHRNHLHIFFIPIFAGCIFVISLLILSSRGRRIEERAHSSITQDDNQKSD